MSQQICPTCATPNSTYAHKCRNCAASLSPRPLPADPALAWTAGDAEPMAATPAQRDDASGSTIQYEAVPRSAALGSPAEAAHDPWPAERLTPGKAESGLGAGLWSGPPADAAAPSGSRGGAQSAAADESLPPLSAGTPTANPEVRRAGQPGSYSFHLGAGGGAAAGNGHHPSSIAPEPSPGAGSAASTAALAVPEAAPALAEPALVEVAASPGNGVHPGSGPSSPAPAAAPAGEASGGRGWAVRESRTPTPAWGPLQADPGAARPGAPPSPPGYSAGPPSFAAAPLGAGVGGTYPWAAGTHARPRSNAVRGLFAVLLLVVLLFAGGFWYFAYGPGAPRSHTVSAPATLGGLQENTSGAVGQVAAAFQARFAGEPGVKSAVYVFYGDGQSTNGYLLGLFAMSSPVTSADLAQFVKGFNSAGPGHFDLASAASTVQTGVTYRCGPVNLSVSTGTLCVWDDVNVIGWVIGLPAVSAAATLGAAEEARSTAEH